MREYHPEDFVSGHKYLIGGDKKTVFEFQSFTSLHRGPVRELYLVFEVVIPHFPDGEFVVRYIPAKNRIEAEEVL